MSKTTKHQAPVATKVLFGCVDNLEGYLPALNQADQMAMTLVGNPPADGILGSESELIEQHDRRARADAKKLLVRYFTTGCPDQCTTPEEGADEIIGEIERISGQAGFLLGFCAALRLKAAIAES